MADRTRTRPLGIILAAGWTLVILALCSIPGDELPSVPVFSADKIGHFGIFAGFGFLWMSALRTDVPTRFWRVLAAGIAYAILTELYQGVMPIGREPDVWDAVANTAGLVVGSGSWLLLHRYRMKART